MSAILACLVALQVKSNKAPTTALVENRQGSKFLLGESEPTGLISQLASNPVDLIRSGGSGGSSPVDLIRYLGYDPVSLKSGGSDPVSGI